MVYFQIIVREGMLANLAVVVVFKLPLVQRQLFFEFFHPLFGRPVVFSFRQVSFGFDFYDLKILFPKVLGSEFFQLRLYQVNTGFVDVHANPTATGILRRNQRGGAAAKRVNH